MVIGISVRLCCCCVCHGQILFLVQKVWLRDKLRLDGAMALPCAHDVISVAGHGGGHVPPKHDVIGVAHTMVKHEECMISTCTSTVHAIGSLISWPHWTKRKKGEDRDMIEGYSRHHLWLGPHMHVGADKWWKSNKRRTKSCRRQENKVSWHECSNISVVYRLQAFLIMV
jgi:hypothetical protein